MNRLYTTFFKIMSVSVLFGLLFWVIDGYFEFLFFHDNLSFLLLEGPETYLESIVFKISPHSLFVRFSYILGSLLGGMLVFVFVSKQRQAEQALRESEEHYRNLFQNAMVGIYRSKTDGSKMLSVNKKLTEIFGYSEDDILAEPATIRWADPADRNKMLHEIRASGALTDREVDVVTRSGEIRTLLTSIKLYRKEDCIEGTAVDITERKRAEAALQRTHNELEKRIAERTSALSKANEALQREVTERRRAETRIKASLKEKEILLREIHHRVKNNFEIISSLLHLSSMHTENPEIKRLWGDARARIYSMALIHTQLYEYNRFDQINMGKHVRELLEHISQIYLTSGIRVHPVIEPSEVCLSVNQAIPCSLVLNELIANAYKHAFKKNGGGTVQICIDIIRDNTVLIKVKDDGDGIPEGIDWRSSDGLGLKLVRHLVDGQLKGKINFFNNDWTEVRIEFKTL